MNGYGLAAEIIKAVASLGWPFAFVVAVWMFRGRLTELLPFLRLKHKDTEVSFRLQQAERAVTALPPPTDVQELPPPTPEERSRFELTAEHSPRAAILEKRVELEAALNELLAAHNIPAKMSLGPAIRLLRDRGLIDSATSVVLDDLRVIGNKAAHTVNEQFSKDEALRFGKLADQTIQSIRGLASFLR
jgi:hypothetical protein